MSMAEGCVRMWMPYLGRERMRKSRMQVGALNVVLVEGSVSSFVASLVIVRTRLIRLSAWGDVSGVGVGSEDT